MKIQRHPANPILAPLADLPWTGIQTRNPGVIYDGGKFRMVFTAASKPSGDLNMLVLGYAESTDGIRFDVRPEPFMALDEHSLAFDKGSLEDVRITGLEGKSYLAYAARAMPQSKFWYEPHKDWDARATPTWGLNFRRVGLATTSDWQSVTRLGPITSEQMCDANVILFPEKIGGKYAMLHRPTPFLPGQFQCLYSPAGIWAAFSDDLLNWGWDDERMHEHWPQRRLGLPDDRLVAMPAYDWECLKIGGSGVPIPTDEGWLTLYHGVAMDGTYHVGLMLLDRENPAKVLARSPKPIFSPEAEYETVGTYKQGPGCVFPCANLVVGDEVFIYYGGMDRHCCLATVKLKELLDEALRFRTP